MGPPSTQSFFIKKNEKIKNFIKVSWPLEVTQYALGSVDTHTHTPIIMYQEEASPSLLCVSCVVTSEEEEEEEEEEVGTGLGLS